MAKLKPAIKQTPTLINICEICGKIVSDETRMYSISVQYNMPGYSIKQGYLPSFSCPQVQHFGCTEDHAVQAAIACLFEHLLQGPSAPNVDGKKHTSKTLSDLQKLFEAATISDGGDGV